MSSENSDGQSDQRLGLFLFDCFMSVLYLILGITLLFTNWIIPDRWQVSEGVKIGLGTLLGLYGIYRVARVTKKMIQRNFN